MILETALNIWGRCDKCQKYFRWRIDSVNSIGVFEMYSPDAVIANMRKYGVEVDEEGNANHIDCSKHTAGQRVGEPT